MQQCCDRTPGAEEAWGNFSSGLTQRRQDNAVRCGYRGIVNRYPGGCSSSCPPSRPLQGSAVPESVALANRVASCKVNVVGTKPLTSLQYTKNLETSIGECAASQLTGDARFKQYVRFFPPACPPVPTEQLNSTLPKPTFIDCQPSRFF